MIRQKLRGSFKKVNVLPTFMIQGDLPSGYSIMIIIMINFKQLTYLLCNSMYFMQVMSLNLCFSVQVSH